MKKASTAGFKLTTQTLVLVSIAWAVISLLFFLLFSIPLPGQERLPWYNPATYVLECSAFFYAGVLCLRNWRSPQIVSGRSVWLAIGLGMFSYFVGNLLLAYWEIGLGKEPDVTPGDFFFLLTYLLLVSGMVIAVFSRQLSLSFFQILVVLGILVGSVALAWALVLKPSEIFSASSEQPAIGAIEPSLGQSWSWSADMPLAMVATAPAVTAPAAPVAPTTAAPVVPEAAPVPEAVATAPGWAVAIEEWLAPFSTVVLFLYLVGDVLLVLAATTLLLAFWGGRFSLSWRFIAAAALAFYIADLWFFYAVYNIEDYETGALPEVFFIFSACLFAIGAALEYDLSTRSRRASRRRSA